MRPFLDRETGPEKRARVLSGRVRLRDIYGDMINVENTAGTVGTPEVVIDQGEARSSAESTRLRLFGSLPDLIRLSEQVGAFDGQVVFIGHPNRDISAHQWSSSPFEWVNIGRYSHSRGRVEGSLASDRLRGIDEPHETIEYFKLAAETRQALVIEKGRSKNQVTIAEPALRGGARIVIQPHVLRDTSVKAFRITDQAQSEAGSSHRPTGHTLLAKDVLEDPFVTAASVALARSANDSKFKANAVNSAGSLDLTYCFPIRTGTDISSVIEFSLKPMGDTSVLSSTSSLQEVAFGEEADTKRRTILTREGNLQQTSWNPYIRPVAPTRPVLSTNHTSSSLNEAAAPYSQSLACDGATIARKADAHSVALQFSDPDGLRKTQQHEVANGLTQQAPTPQNFKGPFFTDSKPTTHNPTASLFVHVSEEEKLINWFHDGQRPARQREYTKSLIAAAVASDRSRFLGTIGGASAKPENGPYANTGPFVRLYENLSEYVEEHRTGGGQSYFTRRWKPAAPKLRETGLEQSRSFFGTTNARPSWPGAAMLRPSDRMWG